jgi:DNA-binding YbaB/EbfC family protein
MPVGGGGGGGGGDLMKQIQQMQSKMAEAQARLDEMEFEATSGGGAVHVVLTAHPSLKSIAIQPDAVDPDDVDMLQDLILAAMNDGLEKVRSGQMQQLAGLAGGLNIPGLNLGE